MSCAPLWDSTEKEVGYLQKWLAAESKFCTGCGACANACPINAIEMAEDARGFFQAKICTDTCVNCGICRRTCPVLNQNYGLHTEEPYPGVLACKAVMANDDVRFQSSSGGAFWAFADTMLKLGGNVAGAALSNFSQVQAGGEKTQDKDTSGQSRCIDGKHVLIEVKHILIDHIADLSKLQKSKYTQSKIGMIFRKILEKLEQDRYVLFCGCPCQVAGLKAYLGKEWEKLITIDLLCHGVPSQKMLNESIDKFAASPIAGIDFRDKNYGWNSLGMTLMYADGSTKRLSYDESRYEQGFHTNMTLCDSCYDCMFCEFPRQGDLSIGDFWGIDEFEADQKRIAGAQEAENEKMTASQMPDTYNDGLGTSLVWINTQKGIQFFASARDRFRMCVDVPPVYANTNRIHAKIKNDPARDHFLALYPTRDFQTAVLYAQQGRADVGIVGNWSYANYGSELTYYALYQVIKEMGNSVLMINWPKSAVWKPDDQAQLFQKQPYAPYEIAPLAQTRSELRELNDKCGIFVLGSDQLLNNNLYHWMDKFMQLDWVLGNKRKVAYAASFGCDYIWGSESDRQELSYFLKRFDAFSVRETSGVALAEKYYGVTAQAVPDPVFLLPASWYEKLAAQSCRYEEKEPYLFCYILDTSKEKADLLKECAASVHINLKSVLDRSNDAVTAKSMWDIQAEEGLSVEEWLSSIKNCTYMVTDSFHGMCFAILFHKPFLAVSNEARGGARFLAVLDELGLQNRLVHSGKQLREKMKLLTKPIDFDSVQHKIDQMSAKGRQWLEQALYGKTQADLSDYDILAGQVYELEQAIRKDITTAQSRMDGLDAVDIKQWEQLEDHRKRLDGLDALNKERKEQLDRQDKYLQGQEIGTKKQWEQLEDHRKRLDGLDASYMELYRLVAELKQMQEKKRNSYIHRLATKLKQIFRK